MCALCCVQCARCTVPTHTRKDTYKRKLKQKRNCMLFGTLSVSSMFERRCYDSFLRLFHWKRSALVVSALQQHEHVYGRLSRAHTTSIVCRRCVVSLLLCAHNLCSRTKTSKNSYFSFRWCDAHSLTHSDTFVRRCCACKCLSEANLSHWMRNNVEDKIQKTILLQQRCSLVSALWTEMNEWKSRRRIERIVQCVLHGTVCAPYVSRDVLSSGLERDDE